jgi:hypothetical protein
MNQHEPNEALSRRGAARTADKDKEPEKRPSGAEANFSIATLLARLKARLFKAMRVSEKPDGGPRGLKPTLLLRPLRPG